LTPTLCEHTTSPAGAGSLPSSRFNIIRHFSTASGDISFTLSKIQAIFELRVPRLQITRGLEKFSPVTNPSKKEDVDMDGAHKKALRREIRRWWEGISDHIDKIVRNILIPLLCWRLWLIFSL
jgi:1-phosphatidylinositol-3-phosphate 5-kinase